MKHHKSRRARHAPPSLSALPEGLRTVRCPTCRKLWWARRDLPYNRSVVLTHFDWPHLECPDCGRTREAVEAEAYREERRRDLESDQAGGEM